MVAKMATKLIDPRFGHGPGNWMLLSLPDLLQQVLILVATECWLYRVIAL